MDERILELLEAKQAAFDAFADRSEAGQMMLELDQRSFRQIMDEEEERIRARQAETGNSLELWEPEEGEDPPAGPEE